MIKPTDIRIGNKIKRNGLVVTADYHTGHDLTLKNGDYEPIPITTEWLNLFHIKSTDDPNKFVHHWKGFYFILEKVGNGYFLKSYCGTAESKALKYIHEVQNLYHSLSGGLELELKPE